MAEGQAAPVAAPDAVATIEAMLDSEQQSAEPATQPKTPPPDAQPAPDAPAEDAPTTPAVEGEDAPADEPAAEIPLEQLEAIELEVTTKGEDGKDVVEKPTIKELRDGYMRQKDYSRKTAEVARQREEVPEKIRQGIESERNSYLTSLQQLQTALIETVAPELKNVDWDNLAANDPFEHVRLRNRAEQIQRTLATIQTKQRELTEKQKADASVARKKAASEAVQALEEQISGWNDDLYHTLMKSASHYGYKPEEAASWVDPKMFLLLHDAQQFRQLKAEKPLAPNRVVAVPKVIRPGPAAPANQAQARASEAMKKLQGSGRLEDAAAVIRSRM